MKEEIMKQKEKRLKFTKESFSKGKKNTEIKRGKRIDGRKYERKRDMETK